MKVGIDVENIDRFLNIDKERFFKKYFTDYEMEYCTKKGVQSIAGIYSCKESVLKAFGIGIGGGVDLKEISIRHDEKGKPFIEENKTMIELKKKFNVTQCEVSISHTKNIVESICIIM